MGISPCPRRLTYDVNVDIWSDPACPWCFIGTERFRTALAAFEGDVKVIWHTFQLDPSLPDQPEGSELDYLARSKGMAREDVVRMTQTVTDVAAEDGLHIDFSKVVPANSRLAHHLIHLAQLRDKAPEAVHALMSARFEHGENIADRDVLVRIGESVGLERADIEGALDSPEYDAAMRSDIAQATGIGIQGVPFFVVDARYAVSGAQPVETFTEALTRAAADAEGGTGGGCCGGSCGCGK